MKDPASPASPTSHWRTLAWRAKFQSAELARLAGMHPRTLLRYFRKRFRTTPQRWLNRLRLREAARLLRAGTRTKEVARVLFYKQASHFCRQFRERHGVSAQRWSSITVFAENKSQAGRH